MDREKLHGVLAELSEELSSSDRVDEETAAALLDIAREIRRLSDGEDGCAQHEVDSVAGRLREAVIQFESEHPRLAVVINQLVDGLASLGI